MEYAMITERGSVMVEKQTKTLYQVDVDIDLSRNADVREMFSNEDAGKRVEDFLKKHKLTIHHRWVGVGLVPVVKGITLGGRPGALLEFVKQFLSEDAESHGVVYTLRYKEDLIDVSVKPIAGAIVSK
jgi:hypothetical protein